EIHFYLDSMLVVNQLNGLFKIKDAKLRLLATDIRILEQEVGGSIHYTAVPREQNQRADFLVNQALDT
ncbi:MAG: reverse transcriptase-like protein, partial [Candidatus Gottesmanbacteria bacterium]|nr:reverse transcriptase-like protein [Candidatus Gottesmanbacteria bacterium]